MKEVEIMKFETLLEIANTHINFPNETLPLDSYKIATQQLNIVVKNSLQCKIDYKSENNPLQRNEAIYVLCKGEYTIYHDENHPYKNFFIAHEIAHHLLDHRSDDINKHHDANMLGAIIVAPPHLIQKSFISNSIMLAEQYKIPIEVADTYWKEYTNIYLKGRHRNMVKFSILGSFSFVLVLSLAIILFQISNIKTQNTANLEAIPTYTTETTAKFISESTTAVTLSKEAQRTVYITKFGEKYHRAGCQYINGKDNIIELPVDKAIKIGYEKCEVCGK